MTDSVGFPQNLLFYLVYPLLTPPSFFLIVCIMPNAVPLPLPRISTTACFADLLTILSLAKTLAALLLKSVLSQFPSKTTPRLHAQMPDESGRDSLSKRPIKDYQARGATIWSQRLEGRWFGPHHRALDLVLSSVVSSPYVVCGWG